MDQGQRIGNPAASSPRKPVTVDVSGHAAASAPHGANGDAPPNRDPAVAAAVARLRQLLPVIRFYGERESFRLRNTTRGIALYSDRLILFRCHMKRPPTEAAYTPDGHQALRQMRGVRIRREIAWKSIESLQAWRRGKRAKFKAVVGGRTIRFAIPRQEAGHVVEVMQAGLGRRFYSSLLPEDIGPPQINWGRRKLGAWLLLVLSIAALAVAGWAIVKRYEPLVAYTLPMLVGGIVTFGYALVLFNRIHRQTHKVARAREPLRSRALGWLLRLIAFVLFACAFTLGPAIIGLWMGIQGQELGDDPGAHVIVAGFAGSMAISILAMVLLHIGYRIGIRRHQRVLDNPKERPILYLRSFDDDNKNNLNPDGSLAQLLGVHPFSLFSRLLGPLANLYPLRVFRMLFGSSADSSEEQLARHFRRLGPFLAIGKPGEWFATGGADRIYVDDQRWQQEVLQLLSAARGIVLQPAGTRGIWWEIDNCVRYVHPQRLLICLVNYEKWRQGYDEFRVRFERVTGKPLPREIKNSQFMRFDKDFTPHLLPTLKRSPMSWPWTGMNIDLRGTLWDYGERIWPDLHRGHKPRPSWHAFGTLGALLIYPAMLYVMPYVFLAVMILLGALGVFAMEAMGIKFDAETAQDAPVVAQADTTASGETTEPPPYASDKWRFDPADRVATDTSSNEPVEPAPTNESSPSSKVISNADQGWRLEVPAGWTIAEEAELETDVAFKIERASEALLVLNIVDGPPREANQFDEDIRAMLKEQVGVSMDSVQERLQRRGYTWSQHTVTSSDRNDHGMIIYRCAAVGEKTFLLQAVIPQPQELNDLLELMDNLQIDPLAEPSLTAP